jgi:SM-20-related protein
MPNADFFTNFGLFVAKDFFDAELRATLLSEVRSATDAPATVGIKGATYAVDESVRKTKWAEVSEATKSFVKERLLALKPALERHFDMTLSDCQEPQFLIYREGDFFHPHRDSDHEPDAAEFSRERQVSTSIFLNGESDVPGSDVYGGGSLRFYGLMEDPRMKERAIPVIGEPGLLVAFRSELVHDVTPVTHGERFSIVTWFR